MISFTEYFFKVVKKQKIIFNLFCNILYLSGCFLYYLIKYNKNFSNTLYIFAEIFHRSLRPTDINEHFILLFTHSVLTNPQLIVELGVRTGESTFVLERVAMLSDATLISVDIEDCSKVSTYDKWFFVRKDDVLFASEFLVFCKDHNIQPHIDILLIDTSHYYEHSKDEIKYFFPFLSNHAKIFFHDTNLVFWDNDRGVIRALENFFNTSFNEKIDFKLIIGQYFISHYNNCQGLTILEKRPQ